MLRFISIKKEEKTMFTTTTPIEKRQYGAWLCHVKGSVIPSYDIMTILNKLMIDFNQCMIELNTNPDATHVTKFTLPLFIRCLLTSVMETGKILSDDLDSPEHTFGNCLINATFFLDNAVEGKAASLRSVASFTTFLWHMFDKLQQQTGSEIHFSYTTTPKREDYLEVYDRPRYNRYAY
jgi:hypothetical protein